MANETDMKESTLRRIIREELLAEQDSVRVELRKISSTDGGLVVMHFRDVEERGTPSGRVTEKQAEQLEKKVEPYLHTSTRGAKATNIGAKVFVKGGHMGGVTMNALESMNRTFDLS